MSDRALARQGPHQARLGLGRVHGDVAAPRGNVGRPHAVRASVPLYRSLGSIGRAALAGCLVVAVSTILGPTSARAASARSTTVRKVFPAAVRIQIWAGGEVVRSASGIAFAAEGDRTYILTNAHVIERAAGWRDPIETRVLPSDGRAPVAARVAARGKVPDLDLAVLEVTAKLPAAALASDDALDLGDDLVVIGAPFGKGLSVAAGIVSQIEYDFSESASTPRIPRSLKTDAAIGYGSSGGGVFDVATGRLVGLVEGYRTARVAFGKERDEYAFDVPMLGETFVAPAAKIRRFLGANGLGRLVPPTAAAAVPPVATVPAAQRL